MTEEDYEKAVEAAVTAALARGVRSFEGICRCAAGADAALVQKVLDRVGKRMDESVATKERELAAEARRRASELPLLMPPEDPMASQWWFTLDSIVQISERAHIAASGKPVAFIGAPTVAMYHSARFAQARLLDIDPDVCAAVVGGRLDAVKYDVADDLPAGFDRTCAAVVIDPPWYRDVTLKFISRAAEIISPPGTIICTLPGQLTRPGVVSERTELTTALLGAGFALVAVESAAVSYRVPAFEAAAYRDIAGFKGRPWRAGDLLVLGVGVDTAALSVDLSPQPITERFSRPATGVRVFLRPDRVDPKLRSWAEPVSGFERNVSTRAFDANSVGAWTSNKKGVRVRESTHVGLVLRAWGQGKTEGEAVGIATAAGMPEADAKELVRDLGSCLGIWELDVTPTPRRSVEEMAAYKAETLSTWAASPSQRERKPSISDGFRLEFQRDRDRVLWSHGLKSLANKTQVFPVDNDDQLRQRLAHSAEVMQLASTIGASFGLDRDLIEAGALAHDVGHTPFGHAGEHALDVLLDEIHPSFGGFNHYEQGVDVLRWLEDAYRSPSVGGFPGLNLVPEVLEAVFKHMFKRRGHRIGQSELWSKSKHRNILKDDGCHLEGQSIRIADKISYLISDLEDGIRMGVFDVEDLRRCRLFDRSPIDLTVDDDETFSERFVAQRRAIIQVLMEDVIVATSARLSTIGSLLRVKEGIEYVVEHSPALRQDVDEVWHKLQSGILHKDSRVVTANMRAARIVSGLVLAYATTPDLVDERFRKTHRQLGRTEYMGVYNGRCGEQVQVPRRLLGLLGIERMIGAKRAIGDHLSVPTADLVLAKDYVAAMSDARARRLYASFVTAE